MQRSHDDLWTRDVLRHPSFVAPPDLDTKLWRYMPVNRFRWLVDHRRLYMPQPVQLAANDAREGTMPDAQAAWWRGLIDNAATPEAAAMYRQNLERMKGFVDSWRSGWFVSCWHRGAAENFAFWRIYGRTEDHCGTCGRLSTSRSDSVAITTTFRVLESVLPAHIDLGLVRYLDYQIDGHDLLNMYDFIMHKRHFYAYESEVRAVASAMATFSPGPASDHIRENIIAGSYAPLVDVCSMIQEIVIHPEATQEFFNEMVTYCSDHGLPKPRLSGLAHRI
jgi:hypothetical protein